MNENKEEEGEYKTNPTTLMLVSTEIMRSKHTSHSDLFVVNNSIRCHLAIPTAP